MFLSQEKLPNSEVTPAFNKYFTAKFNFDFDGSISTYTALELDFLLDFVSRSPITYAVVRTKELTVSIIDGFLKNLLVKAPVLFGKIFSFVLIYNHVWNFPSIWKVARTTLVFKSGSRNCITCCCPNSLLPNISLILEKMLHRFSFSNFKSKLHPKQFGFQPRKNSVLQPISYLNCVYHEKSINRFSVHFD